MGLREKVTITLVIIALIQIAYRHCMPRTPRKASLKRYLNDLKPVKNNPVSTPYSPSRVNKTPKQAFGKTAQNGRISQNSHPKKSLYKTYNFPENEYPLDNSPRDPFHIGMNFNENHHVNTLQKTRNLQSSAISDLKKDMRMKRKLLSNKQVNNENIQLKRDMAAIKAAPSLDSIRLLDSETFPEVQYPLNTMDAWGPNYWNYLPFTQEKPFHKFGQQTFNPKAKKDINKPFTRLTKAKASKYLQSYDKLKEEHRRTSTENSKRSNVGQKGLNFTKTATCERVSDDFITAGLVSNIPSNSTEIKKELKSSTKITTSSENTCPVTEYPYHPMPIPYKVIEENTENIFPAHKPKNKSKELQDVDNSVIAQTLQLIQDILFNDDTSSSVLPGNYSKVIEKNMNTSDYTVILANGDISTTLLDSAKSCTVFPTEELSQEVSDNVGNLRNNMTSLPVKLIPKNTTAVAGPLNVRMSIPFSEPITYEALTNVVSPGPTPLSNSNVVLGSTSIIIIPVNNNAVGKSQSHMFGTPSDTPIIVYLPSTQSSDNASQLLPFNQIVSSALDNIVPNNQIFNVLSNMAPLQNDNPFSTALFSELLNSNSDSGSSLPIHETLPINSMCNNNESSPSLMREKPISDILIDKPLTDDASILTTTWNDKLSEKSTETGDLDENTDTLPPISDFEHPLFDFSGSKFTSLRHGLYNNVLNNELPIIGREIDSDQENSKDLFISTQNATSEQLYKTSLDSVSEDSLSEIRNDAPPVTLDNKFSSVTSTDSIEILKTNKLLPESIPNLPEPVDILTENLPQSIDKILLSTPLTPATKLSVPTDVLLTPAPFSETLSEKLPEIMDAKLSITLVSDTTTDNSPQHIGNTPSLPILNSSPMMTDMTLKTELYKIRHMLDKMLSTEIPIYSQPPPKDTTLLLISDSDSLLLPIYETPTESLPVPALDKTLLLSVTDSPIHSLRQVHTTLLPTSVDRIPTDTHPLLETELGSPDKLLEKDTPSLPVDETILPTLVSDTFIVNKPYHPAIDSPIDRLRQLHKTLPPISVDGTPTDTLSLPENELISPDKLLEKDTPSLPVDETILPTLVSGTFTVNKPYHPASNSLIDRLQVHKTLPPISVDGTPTDILPLPENELISPDKLLEKNTPSLPVDETILPTLVSGTFTVNKPYHPATDSPIDRLRQLHKTLPPISVDGTPTDTLPLPENELISPDKLLEKDPPSLPVDETILPTLVSGTFTVNKPYHPATDSSIDRLRQVHKTLPPISVDGTPTDTLPLPENEMISPDKLLEKDTPSLPVDETILPTLVPGTFTVNKPYHLATDSPIYGLRQGHKTLPPILVDGTPTDTLPLPENELVFPDKLLEKDTPSLPVDETILSTLVSDTFTVNKLYPLGNFVAPLSETITVRTKDTLDNGLSHKMNNLPLKMYLKFPSNYEVSSDDLPLSFDDLPIKIHPEYTKSPGVSTNELPTQVVETLTPVSEVSVRDLPKPADVFSLPVNEVLESASPNVLMDSVKTIMSGLINKLLQDFPSTKVPSDSLPTLPNEFKLTIHKAFPDGQFNEISSKGPHLPLSVQKLIPDLSLSDVVTNEPSLKDYSPSLVIDKNIEFPYSTADTKDLSLVVEHLLSPENDVIPDSLVTDIPSAFLFSTNLKGLQSTNLDKTSDEVPSESILSDLPRDDLPLPADKMLSLTDETPNHLSLPIKKIPSTSKLLITKVFLENVLFDITKGGFSSPVAKDLPVTPHSLLDKTLHYVDVKSPLSETKDIPLRPVEKIFPNSEHNDNLINYVPFSKKPEDTSVTDLLPELPLSMDKMHKDKPCITTDDLEDHDNNETQSLDNSTHDVPVPIDKVFPLKDTIQTPSSSKLPINKALLENVLSDITTRDFSVPIAQSLPVTSPSMLDKTLYYVASPISHIAEDSPSLLVDTILPNTSLSDHSTSNLPISNEDTLQLPLYKTYLELQSLNIPTELSSPIDNIRPDIPNISMYNKEQHESENPSSENLTDDLLSASPMERILSFSKDTPSDLILPNNKTPPSSKLPITKALLENVLSDIHTRGFSSPVAKAVPVAPRSQLDKTLYFIESPVSDMTEKKSVIPIDNFSSSGINVDVPDNPILDISIDKLVINEVHNSDFWTNDVEQKDKSDILTVDVEDRNKSDILTYAVEQEDKSDIFTDDVEDRDISDDLTDDVQDEDPGKFDIWTDDVEDRDISDDFTDEVEDEDKGKSDNLTDDVEGRDIFDILTDYVKDEDEGKSEIFSDDIEIEDSNESLNSDDPTDDMPSNLPLLRTKPYLASRIPITKALLEKVLSDITDGGIHP